MIKKYKYGNPIETYAVVTDIEDGSGAIPYFDIDDNGNFVYTMSEDDIVYGLGEQIRGINKRGWEYISQNADNPNHNENMHSMYGSHNFIIIGGNVTFGAFFDYPGKITFDIGYTQKDTLKIKPELNNLEVYIIEPGENAKEYPQKDIVNQFRNIIGESYIPPLWAFGYGQSRWGYKSTEEVMAMAREYRKLGIPIDSVYLDIDYMDNYKDFTTDDAGFGNIEELCKAMKSEGIHVVPIIDAGVKIEKGYDVYEEGVKEDYFCKDADGNDFVGAVWPGKVHFPDFLKPDAREWFGAKYEKLTKLGIDGFWNDMNEPAIFYTEDRLKETLAAIEELSTKNMGINEYFEFVGMVNALSGNEGDYDKFYHNVDGRMVKHSEVHNLYGMNMTRAASEALDKISPDKKTLFFSRASYIGAHRYGGIWQGDNKSCWGHILQSMQQLPALNMAGFLFVGADTGGFGCDVTEDLMIRWLQYSMFTPLFRNHSAHDTRPQELYRFSTVDIMGDMVKIRYALIPYLYRSFMVAAENSEMMFRPLGFDFPCDEDALQVEDQLMLGDDMMIAPIYKQNAKGRYVYLPEDMTLVRMRKYNEYDVEKMTKGHHYVKADLNEVIFFIRSGHQIEICESALNINDLDFDKKAILK